MDAWKLVREDKADHYRWLMNLMPLARTAMDKKGGKSLERYQKRLSEALDSMTPWTSARKLSALRAKYKDRMPEGTQVIVEFDASDDPESKLFAGATQANPKGTKRAQGADN